ncbi:MAG: 3-keto-5-aminohexanoate cleavage protein, partial [Myxococcota bacterium]
MSDRCIVTCALTGVLTDPTQHPVPVSAEEMALAARQAFDAGAAVMHVHFRDPRDGRGHLPSWDPEVADEISQAIRAACPGVILNMTTGVIGEDLTGPLGCLERTRPEIAACNAGSLNYLKTRRNGAWAWPPMVFDNPVSKVQRMLEAMESSGTRPEFECFDVGIVRSIGLFVHNGMTREANYNFVMGVASGMPADPSLLELLLKYREPDTHWQVTAIGRADVWPLHQRAAELGGALRTGVEDTFYLPSGEKTSGNGPLIEAIVACAERAGRTVASPQEARAMLGL